MTVENLVDIKTKIIDTSLIAGSDEDWLSINDEIESQRNLPDHNLAATELLKFIQHESSQVRDAVVSSLVVLDITDESIITTALKFASNMATNPSEDIFSSGRSAMLLHKYKSYPDIENHLSKFKQIAHDNNWASDLLENIPGIETLL